MDKIVPTVSGADSEPIDITDLALAAVKPTGATVYALPMSIDFVLVHQDGLATGKAGDYVMRGHDGTYYVCPRQAFLSQYTIGVSDDQDTIEPH